MNKTNDDKTEAKPDLATPESEGVAIEVPEILDKVEYLYANHSRLATSKWEVRLAFGEIGPTGETKPKVGVVMSHLHAKSLLNALSRILKALEDRIGEIKDPDETKAEMLVEGQPGQSVAH